MKYRDRKPVRLPVQGWACDLTHFSLRWERVGVSDNINTQTFLITRDGGHGADMAIIVQSKEKEERIRER